MGFQLWISPNTGIRRKGTTFKELQNIFIDNITTKFIYEPVYCCRLNDPGLEVRETLVLRDFDVIGVIDENDNVIGYALRKELTNGSISKFIRKIELGKMTADSTPILELMNILHINDYSFVLESNKVVGIVTRADINKPIVRIYIFGIISLFELHLNFWINEYYNNDSWKKLITEQRLEETIEIYKLRKGNNEELTLLECAQFSDKKEILSQTENFRNQFDFSKGGFEKLLRSAESIRNELAHSQNSIIANLEWNRFVYTISRVETFLTQSEKFVEENTRTHNKV